jgi:hypothetical protein
MKGNGISYHIRWNNMRIYFEWKPNCGVLAVTPTVLYFFKGKDSPPTFPYESCITISWLFAGVSIAWGNDD